MSKWTLSPLMSHSVWTASLPPKLSQSSPTINHGLPKGSKKSLTKRRGSFFTGSESEKKEVNEEVKRAIEAAKLKYKNKMEEKFTEGNLRSAWQGLKNMAALNITTTCQCCLWKYVLLSWVSPRPGTHKMVLERERQRWDSLTWPIVTQTPSHTIQD